MLEAARPTGTRPHGDVRMPVRPSPPRRPDDAAHLSTVGRLLSRAAPIDAARVRVQLLADPATGRRLRARTLGHAPWSGAEPSPAGDLLWRAARAAVLGVPIELSGGAASPAGTPTPASAAAPRAARPPAAPVVAEPPGAPPAPRPAPTPGASARPTLRDLPADPEPVLPVLPVDFLAELRVQRASGSSHEIDLAERLLRESIRQAECEHPALAQLLRVLPVTIAPLRQGLLWRPDGWLVLSPSTWVRWSALERLGALAWAALHHAAGHGPRYLHRPESVDAPAWEIATRLWLTREVTRLWPGLGLPEMLRVPGHVDTRPAPGRSPALSVEVLAQGVSQRPGARSGGLHPPPLMLADWGAARGLDHVHRLALPAVRWDRALNHQGSRLGAVLMAATAPTLSPYALAERLNTLVTRRGLGVLDDWYRDAPEGVVGLRAWPAHDLAQLLQRLGGERARRLGHLLCRDVPPPLPGSTRPSRGIW